jgi:hypothetical protein
MEFTDLSVSFVFSPETAIVSQNINRLFFVKEMRCVYWKVGTKVFNIFAI